MKLHRLKTDPYAFLQSKHGLKPWEIRLNDRDYKVGDHIVLLETEHSGEAMKNNHAPLIFTGDSIHLKITNIVSGYGLMPGWVVMTVTAAEEIDCEHF